MLAMVIRVMIGCVSTNHKSDCEIWPNSFLAAPVSRGEKCLMRSFPPVFFFFFFSFPFFLFPPLFSLPLSRPISLYRVQKNLESVSIEFELGNLEANRDVRRSTGGVKTRARRFRGRGNVASGGSGGILCARPTPFVGAR